MLSIRPLMLSYLCLLICVPCIVAEQYHVSRDEPGASDSNDGLAAVFVSGNRGPWKTLQHAAYQVSAGDTVKVHSGDYRFEDTGWGGPGYVALTNSGTESAPIRFVAAPHDTPIVNRFRIHSVSWIEIEGFTLTSSEFQLPSHWVNMPGTVVDDPSVSIDFDTTFSEREADVRQKFSTYMGIQDFFTTEYTTSIDVKTSTNILIKNNSISLYTFGIQVRAISSNITIENNTIKRCFDGIFTWDPAPSMSDSVIRNNTIRQCFNNGMQIRQGANNVLIENNNIRYSGTSHITVISGSTNCTIRSNQGIFGGYYSETMVHPGSSSINVHSSSSGIVVERNYAAFQVDLTGNDGNGYIVDLMPDGDSVLLRNNIAFRNMGSGIRTVESPNCIIANNTLVDNGFLAVNPRAGVGIHLAREQDINTVIVNNIFYKNPVGGIRSYFLIDDQLLIDNNLYHGSGPLIWDGWQFDENVYWSLEEIQNTFGFEIDGVNQNPLFVNRWRATVRRPFLKQFEIRETSPAIDAGLNFGAVTDDYSGKPRPQGASHDIGAHERK